MVMDIVPNKALSLSLSEQICTYLSPKTQTVQRYVSICKQICTYLSPKTQTVQRYVSICKQICTYLSPKPACRNKQSICKHSIYATKSIQTKTYAVLLFPCFFFTPPSPCRTLTCEIFFCFFLLEDGGGLVITLSCHECLQSGAGMYVCT